MKIFNKFKYIFAILHCNQLFSEHHFKAESSVLPPRPAKLLILRPQGRNINIIKALATVFKSVMLNATCHYSNIINNNHMLLNDYSMSFVYTVKCPPVNELYPAYRIFVPQRHCLAALSTVVRKHDPHSSIVFLATLFVLCS